MIKTADKYIGDLSLYDLRLISTLGFTESDVEAFAELDGIEKVCGAFSADMIYVSNSGSDAVLHAHSLADGINGLDMRFGRMPEKPDECVLDAKFTDESFIGSKLVLSADNPEDTLDMFAFDEYTVVGTANASYYMNYERGGTPLGSGSASGFVYMLPEGFDSEIYTEIFLTLPRSGEIYSDEYDSAVDDMREKAEDLLDERGMSRYTELRTEAEDKLNDARAELSDEWETYRSKRADAEAELADAKLKLDDTASELEKADKELAEGRDELEKSRRDTKKMLSDAKEELADAKKQIDESEEKLESCEELYFAGAAFTAELNAAFGTNFGTPSELMAMIAAESVGEFLRYDVG